MHSQQDSYFFEWSLVGDVVSGGTGIKILGFKRGQEIFGEGGWQNPQKMISFDHFVQENANFFLNFIQCWGMPPLPSPGATMYRY